MILILNRVILFTCSRSHEVSFLLISFWSSRVQAVKAGIKAVVVNKIGDCGYLLGCLFIFKYLRCTWVVVFARYIGQLC